MDRLTRKRASDFPGAGAPGSCEPVPEFNERGARYLVIGGFAIIAAGYARTTGELDLSIDASLENEARVFKASKSCLTNA